MRIAVLKSEREKGRLQAQKDGDLKAQSKVYSDYAKAKKEAQDTLVEDLREAHGEIDPKAQAKDAKGGKSKASARKPMPYSFKTVLVALASLILLQTGIEAYAPEKYKPKNWYKTWKTHNPDSFHLFEIVKREAVSSTASLYTLRPFPLKMGKDTPLSRACDEAQQKGLWNVQFKQPQIQVVRAYTPLPILDGKLRYMTFLVRHEKNGEVSNWLKRLPVGSPIELRGPFVEFEMPKDTDRVIFLAGGTGIAPAMQAAEALLRKPARTSDQDDLDQSRKHIDILWAVRHREDCVGAPPAADRKRGWLSTSSTTEAKSWLNLSSLWKSTPPSTSSIDATSTAEQQPVEPNATVSMLNQLQTRYPGQISITYCIDEEWSFITADTLKQTLNKIHTTPSVTTAVSEAPATTPQIPSTSPQAQPDPSSSALTSTSSPSSPPPPPPKTQILISGPSGFIAALAGPKVWTAEGEEQGPLGGMLGKVLPELAQQRDQEGFGEVSVYKI